MSRNTIIKLKDLDCDKFKEVDKPQFYGDDGKPIWLNTSHMAIKLRPVEDGGFFELSKDKRIELTEEMIKEADIMKCHYFYEIQECKCIDPTDMKDYFGYMIRGAQKDGHSLYLEYIGKIKEDKE